MPIAEVRGVNVHAKQVVDGSDRPRLERLARYITRPPLATERLKLQDDGRVRLELKSVWRDGTRALLLEPQDLISRLCAAVPPPRFNMLRYFGVLSGHSALRSEVVPEPPPRHLMDDSVKPAPITGDQLGLDFLAGAQDDRQAPRRKRWGWMLRHVFREDVDHCDLCGGPMRWLEVATTNDAIQKAMADHGLAPAPAPRPKWRPPQEQLALGFG